MLDARGAKFFARGHIPGALSLPVNDFDAGYRRLQSRLEEDRDRRSGIYGSSLNCPDSGRLRDKLEKLGYRRVDVFKGGFWSAVGAGTATVTFTDPGTGDTDTVAFTVS